MLTQKQIYDAVWDELTKWREGMSDEVKNSLATRISARLIGSQEK